MITFRQRLQAFFESESLSIKIWDLFIYGLIFVSIIHLLGEYNIFQLGLTSRQNVIIDLIIASIFSIDYLARIYASPSRKKFFFNLYSMIDLLAILPSFIGFGDAKALRGFRILRAFRALRFLRIVKLIHALEIKDNYDKGSEAYEEVACYNKIMETYLSMKKGNGKTKLRNLLDDISRLLDTIDSKINENSEQGTPDVKQTFYISFYEVLNQIHAIIKGMIEKTKLLDKLKLKYLIQELGLLLTAEHTKGKVRLLHLEEPSKNIQFFRLIKISVHDILITFSVAIALNVLLRMTGVYALIVQDLQYLTFIEGAMGGLIVFITSFNMSYTNGKRGNTDLALIEFTNLLIVYSEQIYSLIIEKEQDSAKKRILFKKIDHYFDCIGLEIINGVRQGNAYHLRFDTQVVQSLDRIKGLIAPYVAEMGDNPKTWLIRVHDQVITSLNKFQTISTIRAAIIFNALNHWMIRITYFVLVSLSPFSALPRLFVVNTMQRAFHKTANETDKAVFNISLSKLPVEDRILRRLCRISGIFQL